MSPTEIQEYRTKLLSLADNVGRGLAHDRHELRREDDPDMPGGPMPSTEDRVDCGAQEVELGLIANEENLLAETRAALARIDTGAFGVCATCGKAIAHARLKALPYARDCIRCARAASTTH
jgi:DnaK suppressor protein